jgi:hypothetical protein
MRRIASAAHRLSPRPAAVMLLFAVACGGADGATAPVGLSPATVNGDWTLELTDLPNCGRTRVTRTWPVTLSFASDGQTGSVGSYWSNVTRDPRKYPLTGTIRFESGATDLLLWARVDVMAIALSGTVGVNGEFVGTARDPAPGYGAVYNAEPCDYSVTGQRR